MGYFKFKEQRVFYQIIGEGKPMVLQHGYMQWGDDWHYAGWAKHLSKNHKLESTVYCLYIAFLSSWKINYIADHFLKNRKLTIDLL